MSIAAPTPWLLQLISAEPGWRVRKPGQDPQPVVCWALVETEHGPNGYTARSVQPVALDPNTLTLEPATSHAGWRLERLMNGGKP